eukprot:gene2616-2859_t
MIDALIQHWTRALLPPPPPAPATSSPESSKPLTNAILDACYATLAESTDPLKGKCRSLQAALVALKVTQTLVDHDPSLRIAASDSFASLVKMMDAVEDLQMQSSSFSGKHVVVLEGLTAIGKTTLAQQLTQKSSTLCYLSPKNTEIYEVMNRILVAEVGGEGGGSSVTDRLPFLPALFHQLLNYFLAAAIVQSPCMDFIVEEYHHAYMVEMLSDRLAVEEVSKAEHGRLYAWPADLPMPELVLYLTASPQHRLERLQRVSSTTTELPSSQVAEALYSMIRGPGTVGIEADGSPEEICSTTLQALDYFGVYSISRSIVPPQPPVTAAPTTTTAEVVADNNSFFQDENVDFNSQWAWEEPVLSKEVIRNRRTSIGVYGLYSKLC